MILVISILIAAAGCYSAFIGYLILVSKTQLKLPSNWNWITPMASWILAKSERPANKTERILFGLGYIMLGAIFIYLSFYFQTNIKF